MKKTISLILAVILILLAFGGCSTKSDAPLEGAVFADGTNNDYDGLENITFAPLFQYLDAHGISMEQIIEDGVITETIAEMFANNITSH